MHSFDPHYDLHSSNIQQITLRSASVSVLVPLRVGRLVGVDDGLEVAEAVVYFSFYLQHFGQRVQLLEALELFGGLIDEGRQCFVEGVDKFLFAEDVRLDRLGHFGFEFGLGLSQQQGQLLNVLGVVPVDQRLYVDQGFFELLF